MGLVVVVIFDPSPHDRGQHVEEYRWPEVQPGLVYVRMGSCCPYLFA